MASLIALPDDAAAEGGALAAVRDEVQRASLRVPDASQGATRIRFYDFCRQHHLGGWVSSGTRKEGTLKVQLTWPASTAPGGARHALWGARFVRVTDQDREDRALELALAAAQGAHDHLVEAGLEPPLRETPPRETRSWLSIGADGEFERIDMFDARQREAGWHVLRELRCEEVALLALDEEGSGHCSCGGACAGERVHCATTFVQVCIWRRAAPPLVVLDFWPEAEDWARLVAERAPTPPVATWGRDPLAARIFGRRVLDLQREAGAHIRADLQLGSARVGQRQLGLKAAYAWVAHRRGGPVPVYPKPEGVHAKPGCWQRRHEARLLTEDHKRYAAADAYATGALFCEYLRLQAEGGAAVGAHGQPAPV